MEQIPRPPAPGRHFYRPADLSGIAVALFEDPEGRQARLGAYLRDAGARVRPVTADAAVELLALADVAVLNRRDPEPAASRAATAGLPVVVWGRVPLPPRAGRDAALVSPEVGPEQLASAVLVRVAVRGAGLAAPDALGPDELLSRLRLMARLLVHDAEAADAIVEIALERGLDALPETASRTRICRLMVALVEEVWREQKLSRLS